jgi:hypothetical protein
MTTAGQGQKRTKEGEKAKGKPYSLHEGQGKDKDAQQDPIVLKMNVCQKRKKNKENWR